jgi:hypothetical protein
MVDAGLKPGGAYVRTDAITSNSCAYFLLETLWVRRGGRLSANAWRIS